VYLTGNEKYSPLVGRRQRKKEKMEKEKKRKEKSSEKVEAI